VSCVDEESDSRRLKDNGMEDVEKTGVGLLRPGGRRAPMECTFGGVAAESGYGFGEPSTLVVG